MNKIVANKGIYIAISTLFLAVVFVYPIIKARAIGQNYAVSVEAELGSLSGAVQVNNDTTASNGQYIIFNTPPTSTPAALIQLDGKVQTATNSGGNIILSNYPVTGSNANRFLLVTVGSHQGGAASGVTFGGATMTKLAEQIGQFGEFVQLWGLQAPTGGSGNIVTSGINGGDFTFLAAYSLFNVKQTYTLKTNTLSQNGNSSSVSFIPNSANNWIIDAIEAEPVPSVIGANVQDWAQDGTPNSYDNGNGSRIQQTGGPTTVSMSWNLSYGGRSNQAAVVLEPSSSGALTPTPSPTSSPSPTPSQLTLSNLTIADTANANNYSFQSNIQAGNTMYGDRTYTIKALPSSLAGALWIRTANNSKTWNNGNTLLSFQINKSATISVAVDKRLARPAWIDNTWTNSGLTLTDSEGHTISFAIFQKVFPAGTVNLGPNAGVVQSDMYTVIAQ